MVDRREIKGSVPSARRLITSLRDLGYDFVKAAADIIDNSIEANATDINIRMRFENDHSWFQVADNGRGMTPDELDEAMRFGTERSYRPDELGKFGLGLKTASISQSRKLTVASRSEKEDSEIEIRQLNLDHIDETDKWEIISIPTSEYSDVLWSPLNEHPGTVVQWESLDRMLLYDPPDGMRAEKGFLKLARELEEHISMVFHRFLSGEVQGREKITIRINGMEIQPWDPFARSERNTIALQGMTVAVVGTGGVFRVHYSPYILPPRDKFSSPEAFRRSSGPSKWNRQQGFYVYRENRMIQSGGWNRMRTEDEHTKLARIAIDLHSDADSSLGLNVMKSSIIFPSTLKEALKPVVNEVGKIAKKAYTPVTGISRSHASSQSTQSSTNQSASEKTQSQPAGTPISEQQSENHGTGGPQRIHSDKAFGSSGIAVALERSALLVGESKALTKIRERLKRDDPAAASEIGW